MIAQQILNGLVVGSVYALFALGFVLAIVLAGLLSVALDWVAFRPLRKRGAPEFSAIVSSIGAGLVLMNIAQRVSDTRVLRYPFGTLPIENLLLPGLACDLDPGGDGPEHASD